MSGSVELFPQHCQVPFLMWNKHLQEVINKLVTTLHKLLPEKHARVLFLFQDKLSTHTTIDHTCTLTHPTHDWLLPPTDIQRAPYIPPPQQRVEQRVNTFGKQRVERFTKIPFLIRITDAPPIMAAPNPTQKRTLKLTKQTYSKRTWNNVPGSVPLITPTAPCCLAPIPTPILVTAPWQSPRTATPIAMPGPT
jgi:hypothetical protein